MPSSLVPILIVAAFVGLAYIAIQRARKLKQAERAALQRLGFAALPTLEDAVRQTVASLRRLQDKPLQVRNVYEYRSLDYRILRFELVTREQEDHNRLVYALVHPGLDLPRFSVVPALKLPGVLGALWSRLYRHIIGRTGLEEFPVHGCSRFTDKYTLLAGERGQDLRHVQRSTWERLAAMPHHLFLDARGDTMVFQFLIMPGKGRRRVARSDAEQELAEHVATGEQLSDIWGGEFRRVGPARVSR